MAMANVGRIVAEVGKALGKAVIAGLGLELARVTTVFVRRRLGADDNAQRSAPTDDARDDRAAQRKPSVDDDVEALRRENQALREELRALQAEVRGPRSPTAGDPPST
jgi:hypothetical protein